MEGGIAAASGEIVRLRQVDSIESSRLRLSRAITSTDLALEKLEQLNLAGSARVPQDFALKFSTASIEARSRPTDSANMESRRMKLRSNVIRETAARAPARQVKVLLVEDHKVVAQGLRSLISQEPDLEVLGVASSVEEAARVGRELKPDVLLVDFRLPDGNGAEAVAAIRRTNPKVRVLFLSAVDNPGALMTAIQVGARGYLLKANAAEEVVQAVRRVAAGEMLISATALAALIAEKGEQTHLLDTLTQRERQVLGLIAQGLDNRTVADRLGVEYGTVRSHVRNLIAKLEVHNKMQAIVRAAQLGLLEPQNVGLPHLD